MRDLVTRLILDNSNFERNLQTSAQQVRNFRDIESNMIGVLGKFSGVATAAVGGMELFNTAIHSNQRLQDNWNIAIGTATESVNSFFTALTTGKWTVFEDGILNAIKLASDYTTKLKQLKTNLLIGDIGVSDDELLLDKYDNIASNEALSKKEREKGFADFKKQFKTAQLYVEQMKTDSNKKLKDMLVDKGLSSTNLSAEDVKKLLRQYYPNFTTQGKKVDMYQRWQEDLPSVLGTPKTPVQIKRAQEALARFDKQDPLIKLGAELRTNFPEGEKLEELVDIVDKIIGLKDRAEQMVAQDISLSKDFTKEGKLKPTSSTKPTTVVLANDKDAEIKVDFKPFTKEYYKQIEAEQKRIMDKELKVPSPEWKSAGENLKVTQSILDFIETGKGAGEYYMLQHELEKNPKLSRIKNTPEGKSIDYDKMTMDEQDWAERMELFYLKNNLRNDKGEVDTAKFDKYIADYFTGTKSSVTTIEPVLLDGSLDKLRNERTTLIKKLNSATTDKERIEIQARITTNKKQEQNILKSIASPKDKWVTNLQGVGSSLSSINQLCTALSNLQVAMSETGKSSKSMARAMAFTSAASSIAMLIATMVEKTKTSVTVWDWIAGATAGVATVVSLAAQLKSISKYADGGIVGGNSTIGDYNIARVNAGEMILNNRQQRNLFSLLNEGGSSSVSTNGQVEFKISGKQLVGVLNNYNKQRFKV